jgi:anti-sigma factor RsiW
MRCRKAQHLLSAGEPNEAVRDHLDTCAECRAFQADLDTLADRLVPLMPAPEPRAGFAGRTLARIPDGPPRPRWLDLLLDLLHPAPVALATATAALGIFLAATMNGGADPPTDAQSGLFAEFFDLPLSEEAQP